jgi:hypothetical protein
MTTQEIATIKRMLDPRLGLDWSKYTVIHATQNSDGAYARLTDAEGRTYEVRVGTTVGGSVTLLDV